jgi:heat shock protein HslJ
MKKFVITLVLGTILLIPGLLMSGSCSSENTDLHGTAWHAVSINGTPIIEGNYISLYLWSDGSVFGNAGINLYNSKWTSEGNQVNFHSDPNYGGVTMIGGPENIEEQETAYLKAFWPASTFKIDGNQLFLYDADGTENVVYDRIQGYNEHPSDLADTAWQLETVNGEKISDDSNARLSIYDDGTAYGQAGSILMKQDYITEDYLIRSAGGGAMRIGSSNEESGNGSMGLCTFAAGTYGLKRETLYTYSASGTTATFKKFNSSYTFDESPPELYTGTGGASWAVIPDDMAEVIANSDIIVMGIGLGYIGIEKGSGSKDSPMGTWKSGFRVDVVFKGENPREIILKHSIFQNPDGSFQTFRTDPPVQPGEKWILFLRQQDDGTYHEFGPWGRYQIINDKVYSMNRVLRNNNDYYVNNLDFNGEDAWTFFRELQGTLSSSALTFYDQRNELLAPVFGVHTSGFSDTLDAKFSTGRSASGTITFTIRRVDDQGSDAEIPMPAGLDVWMDPSELVVEPDHEYSLVLHADTSRELPVGIYWMIVDAKINDKIVASRAIIVSIHQPQ